MSRFKIVKKANSLTDNSTEKSTQRFKVVSKSIVAEQKAAQKDKQNVVKTASRYQAMTVHEKRLLEEGVKDAHNKVVKTSKQKSGKATTEAVKKYNDAVDAYTSTAVYSPQGAKVITKIPTLADKLEAEKKAKELSLAKQKVENGEALTPNERLLLIQNGGTNYTGGNLKATLDILSPNNPQMEAAKSAALKAFQKQQKGIELTKEEENSMQHYQDLRAIQKSVVQDKSRLTSDYSKNDNNMETLLSAKDYDEAMYSNSNFEKNIQRLDLYAKTGFTGYAESVDATVTTFKSWIDYLAGDSQAVKNNRARLLGQSDNRYSIASSALRSYYEENGDKANVIIQDAVTNMAQNAIPMLMGLAGAGVGSYASGMLGAAKETIKAVSKVTATVANLSSFGVSVFGGAYKEGVKINPQANESSLIAYAGAVTAAELLMEYMFSLIPGGKTNVSKDVFENIAEGVANPILKTGIFMFGNGAGEFVEEYSQALLSPVLQKWFLGADASTIFSPSSKAYTAKDALKEMSSTFSDGVYEGMIGFISGVTMGSVDAISSARSQIELQQLGANYKKTFDTLNLDIKNLAEYVKAATKSKSEAHKLAEVVLNGETSDFAIGKMVSSAMQEMKSNQDFIYSVIGDSLLKQDSNAAQSLINQYEQLTKQGLIYHSKVVNLYDELYNSYIADDMKIGANTIGRFAFLLSANLPQAEIVRQLYNRATGDIKNQILERAVEIGADESSANEIADYIITNPNGAENSSVPSGDNNGYIPQFSDVTDSVDAIANNPITQQIITEFNTKNEENKASTVKNVSEEFKNLVAVLMNGKSTSVDTINELPEIAKLLEDVYSRAETYSINTQERINLRKKIINKLLNFGSYSGVDGDGNSVYNGIVKREQRADIVIGLSAAGKSSILVDPLSEFYSSRVIDSDMAKEELPEFSNGIGANAVHRESQDIIQDVLTSSIKSGDNIVWPIVGGGKVNGLIGKLKILKDNGYSVYLHLNELPNGKAIGRSLNRYIETGRFIPPNIIWQYGDTPTQNFNTIVNMEGLVDGYSHYSNDVERGQKPELIKISENVREFDERRQRRIQRTTQKKIQGGRTKNLNSFNTQATSNEEVASFVPENEQGEDFESGEENNTPETQNPVSEEFEEDFEENRPTFREPSAREIAREASPEEKISSLLGETMSLRQRQVNAIAEKFGLTIRWTNKIPMGTFNPKTNTISMNPDTTITEAYIVILKHEWMHYLENRREYKAFKDYLFEDSVVFEDYIKGCLKKHNGEEFIGSREEAIEAYTEIVFERRKNAKEIPSHIRESYTTEKIEREIVADFCGDVLIGADNIEESERALNEIAQTHRNFIQRIIDFISDWIDKIRGEAQNRTLKEDLEYLNARLARVYDSKAQKNTTKDGDVKYSLNKNAKSELHKALYDFNYRNEVLLRDVTPPIMLSQKGVKNLPMVMNASHIRENVFTEEEARNLGLKVNEHTHYHGIGENYFLQIIDNLDNVNEAYRGTKNANMPSRREKYFLLVTEFKDSEGNVINVPVYIEEGAICNNVYLTSNKFATVFGRSDFRKYINEQVRKQNLVRIKNKNNAYSEGGVPLPPAYESIVSNDSITDNEPTVNSNYMQESENNSDEIFAISKFDFAAEMQSLNDKLKSGEITAEEFIRQVNKISKKETAVSDKLRAAIEEIRKENKENKKKLTQNEKTVLRQRKRLQKRRKEVFEDVYATREERATKQKNIEYIRREVRRLDTAFRTNSDTKNVPENLKDAIGGFIKIFAENDRSPFDKKNLALIHLAYSGLGGDIGIGGETVMSTFDPQVERDLNILSSTLDGKTLRDLSYGELIMVRNIVDNFKHMLSAEKEIMVAGKKYEIDELGKSVMRDLSTKKATREFVTNRIYYEMLTPAYFFKHIGGPLAKIASDIFKGQGVWYRNMKLAKTYIAQIKEECSYDESWETETLTIETEQSETLKLTIEQALLLYATARREYSNKTQNSEHLFRGGVVLDTSKSFEDKVKSFIQEFKNQKEKPKFLDAFCKEIDSRAHQITPLDAGRVREMLTENQIKYADKMVEYLSNDMAVLGNEVSMRLFGIKKYTENYYIPYNSARNFLASQPGVTSDVSLKHQSFTHNTQYKANNPLVLSSFSEVCTGHIEKMCMYNAMALPVDNLTKMLNWKTVGKEGLAPKSIRAELERTYGKEAVKYLERFIEDINGNIRSSGTEDFASKLHGKAKMSQVAANASVVVQQYSSIVRATSIIPAKYFISTIPSVAEKNYEQLKEYSSVAGIKEMGRFDTGVGVTNTKWLLDSSPVGITDKVKAFVKDSSYRKDVFGWAAGKMDELVWGHIWAAVKAEIKDTTGLKPGTEEFFEAAGEKIDEVINLTQVYDSTLSRSQIMRDKGFWARSVTAFMSEQTITFNMVCDAVFEIKSNGKAGRKRAGAILSSVVMAIAINNVLKSFITAARDDDEDESYLEKYIAAFVNNFISDLNPLNYIPVIRDLLSMAEGYTPERAELTFIGDIITSGKKLLDGKNTKKEYIDFLSSVAVAFDIPLKNIIRDLKAAENTFTDIFIEKNDTTATGIKYAITEPNNSQIYADMVNAINNGNEEEYQRIYDHLIEIGKDESKIRSGIKSAFKESKSIISKTEKYIGKLEGNKTFESFDEESQEGIKKNIADALAKEKTVKAITKNGVDYDALYEAQRRSKSAYKKARQDILDKGVSEGEIEDGLFVAKIKYMKSVGIDVHEYMLYKMATNKAHADTDGSGGVSNAEKRKAISKIDVDDKTKAALYRNMS